MARLDELAQGIATLLKATSVPEPLPIDMMYQSPAGATIFVRAVIDASARIATPLSQVAICPKLGNDVLRQHGNTLRGYQGIPIIAIEGLENRIEFFRFSPLVGPVPKQTESEQTKVRGAWVGL